MARDIWLVCGRIFYRHFHIVLMSHNTYFTSLKVVGLA